MVLGIKLLRRCYRVSEQEGGTTSFREEVLVERCWEGWVDEEEREVNSTHAFGRVSTLRSNQRLGATKLELEDAA